MSQILDKIHDFCVQNPGHLKLLIDLVYVRLGATIFFDCCVTDLVLWAIFGVTNFVFFRNLGVTKFGANYSILVSQISFLCLHDTSKLEFTVQKYYFEIKSFTIFTIVSTT